MALGEDEVDRLMRMLAERRADLVSQITSGTASSENVSGGYREIAGHIMGLDQAADLVREVFRGWLPQAPPKPAGEPKKGIPGDY